MKYVQLTTISQSLDTHHRYLSLQQQSSLMRLPAELRNRIYLEFFGDLAVGIGWAKVFDGGILLACRRTYDEGVAMFYSKAAFTSGDRVMITAWIMHLPAHRVPLLRCVRQTTFVIEEGDESGLIAEAYWMRWRRQAIRDRISAERLPLLEHSALQVGIQTEVRGPVVWTSDPAATLRGELS